ncbi:response regulator transcription factor [Clostridioides difficile]|nr:response regulator transcription factor [Clostridioides difficile]
MYRVAICEDDSIQRLLLKDLIYKIFNEISNQIEILEFSSGEELIKCTLEGIDIFFLDIQMDKLTGIDVAKKIRQKDNDSEIIFITSLIDYIQDGYKVRAYRYLLKPIQFEDLKENILTCISDIIKKRENYLIVNRKGSIDKILIDRVTYIEVNKKDITIHTLDDFYCTKNTIEKLEKELEIYGFFRCHKSYLVNLNHIKSMSRTTIIINNENIPVSKHRVSDLKTKLTYVLGSIIC